jgi:predicted cobalt transporter CbtA
MRGDSMIAAIILTGFMGLAVIVWRRNVFTLVLGLALLAACGLLFWHHWEWLQG